MLPKYTPSKRFHSEVRQCKICGKEFTARAAAVRAGAGRGIYCSKSCSSKDYWAHHRKGVTRICKTCGKSFNAFNDGIKNTHKTAKYCSNKCKGARTREAHLGRRVSDDQKARQSAKMKGRTVPSRRKPPIELICLNCQRRFMVPRGQNWRAKKIRFCCKPCWYAYLREHPEIHYLFKGGREPYYGPNWKEQARLARARDNNTCQDCGKQQSKPLLPVHHIRARREFHGDHKAANQLDNLVTLCKSCHSKRETLIHPLPHPPPRT